MPDAFASHITGLSSPAQNGFAVTPSDSVDLPTNCRSLYVGTAGNIVLVTAGGTTLTFVNVGAGSILPVRADRVRATGTTAGSIIALV